MTNEYTMDDMIRAELDNPDIVGVYQDTETRDWMLDRRYTADALARLGIDSRVAELNLVGDTLVPIPLKIRVEKLGLVPTRGSVKRELLRLRLPGISV